jgi:hypothetical protein
LPRVDSKFSKRISEAESVHQSEKKKRSESATLAIHLDQILNTDVRDRGRDHRFHHSPGQPDNVEGGQSQRDECAMVKQVITVKIGRKSRQTTINANRKSR